MKKILGKVYSTRHGIDNWYNVAFAKEAISINGCFIHHSCIFQKYEQCKRHKSGNLANGPNVTIKFEK